MYQAFIFSFFQSGKWEGETNLWWKKVRTVIAGGGGGRVRVGQGLAEGTIWTDRNGELKTGVWVTGV